MSIKMTHFASPQNNNNKNMEEKTVAERVDKILNFSVII